MHVGFEIPMKSDIEDLNRHVKLIYSVFENIVLLIHVLVYILEWYDELLKISKLFTKLY